MFNKVLGLKSGSQTTNLLLLLQQGSLRHRRGGQEKTGQEGSPVTTEAVGSLLQGREGCSQLPPEETSQQL